MQFYTIPPNSNLELIRLGQRAFCLTQLYVKDKNYRNYFKQLKEQGWWITMDSGIGDHNPVTQDVLFEAMKDLRPSEVIPVDTLFNREETLSNLEDFIQRLIKEDLLDQVEIFACPQGKTKNEWLDCYTQLLANHHVKTIGLSKLAIPHAFLGNASNDQGIMEARHECVEHLINNNLIQKPLHMLGMGSPLEMIKYRDLNNPLFRSSDSCNSIWSAMNGLDWTKEQFERIRTPHDYFDRIMTDEQITLAVKNIQWYKELLSGE